MAAPSYRWVLTRKNRFSIPERVYVAPDMSKVEDYRKAKYFRSCTAARSVASGTGLYGYVAKQIPQWMW